MSLTKTAVFIASRFEEFRELRERLANKIANHPIAQFVPIDLSNGHVSHRPPLTECLAHIRRSEFVILLLGDEYGSIAPGTNKSFTHIEYDEAVRDESGARILVFCIGEHYRNRRIRFSDAGSPLGDWQREIEKRHTVGFFEPDATVEQMAQDILENLLIALYEMRFGQIHVDTEGQHNDLFDAIADDSVLDDSDVTALESRDFQLRGLSLVNDRSQYSDVLDVLLKPAAVAAFEQREEAQRAIALADYGCAIRHLQRAIEHRPLDLMSNYWLATLYISLGRKQDCIRARELSERAARIALDVGAQFRAAAAYILAARAARIIGQDTDAVAYATRATEVAPRYAQARIELARCHLVIAAKPAAISEIREAANLYFPSLREIFVDPVFRPLRGAANSIIEESRVQLVANANKILAAERRLPSLAPSAHSNFLSSDASRRAAIEAARQSATRQHDRVCNIIERAIIAVAKLSTEASSEGSKLRDELLQLEDFRRNDTSLLATGEAHYETLQGSVPKLRAYWALGASMISLVASAHWWFDGQQLFGIAGGLLGLYLLAIGRSTAGVYRHRLGAAQAKVVEIKTRISGYAARRSSLEEFLAELYDNANDASRTAKEGLKIFEVETLRYPIGILPFTSLFSSKRGDIVRIWGSQRDAFAQKSGRKLEIEREFPTWLDEGETSGSIPKLYLVERSAPDRLTLSRAGAYRCV